MITCLIILLVGLTITYAYTGDNVTVKDIGSYSVSIGAIGLVTPVIVVIILAGME